MWEDQSGILDNKFEDHVQFIKMLHRAYGCPEAADGQADIHIPIHSYEKILFGQYPKKNQMNEHYCENIRVDESHAFNLLLTRAQVRNVYEAARKLNV